MRETHYGIVLELMGTKEKKETLDKNSSEVPVDGGVFAGEAADGSPEDDFMSMAGHERLSEHEVFVGDEDFYKLLANSGGTTRARQTEAGNSLSENTARPGRFSILQKFLMVCIASIATMLLYMAIVSQFGSLRGIISKFTGNSPSQVQQAPVAPATSPTTFTELKPAPKPMQAPPTGQPLSLEVARNLYLQKNYTGAYDAYERLRQALPPGEDLLRDFLGLQMALCSREAADLEQANNLLMTASQSRSPAIRIAANYSLSLLEIQRKRYLRARTRAYNAIALTKSVDFTNDWILSFECDCYFLAAECLTRYILSLSNADSDLPADLWTDASATFDPFGKLSEAELRKVLDSGTKNMERALLDPRIQKLENQNGLSCWSVTSYGAPIEELLSKFAAGANLDIQWAIEESGADNARQRPVSLHLPSATSRQTVLIAAGAAGLLANLEDTGGTQKVTIFDPTQYSSLSQHISFLSQHAISLWQTFVLTFYSDSRLGNAHFLTGMLESQIGLPTEAIAEFKLVANRFSQMTLAPYALLHSSRLKASIRDYYGAREDLKQLVEQYPDTEIYGQAYLGLADATRDAGLVEEAAQLYERVYNFGLSAPSKISSALGAAQCCYETKAYEEAAKWLLQYITLAGNDKRNNLYSAYFLLGQTSMASGKYQEACNAFEYALGEQSSREQYIEAITALVKSHIEQEHFVEALDALENVQTIALSQEQSVEMLLLKSKILRLLGLVDTAVVSLRDRSEYIADSQLNARIFFELSQCHIANGDLELARSVLSETLLSIEPGLLAQTIALELADVCLKLGRSSQAVSVCLQLLDSDLSSSAKQKTLKILAAAYRQQKDYDKAALALSGQWK